MSRHHHKAYRLELLECLYDSMEANPGRGAVWPRSLPKDGDLAFALWYLEDRGLVGRMGLKVHITAAGVDVVEASSD